MAVTLGRMQPAQKGKAWLRESEGRGKCEVSVCIVQQGLPNQVGLEPLDGCKVDGC